MTALEIIVAAARKHLADMMAAGRKDTPEDAAALRAALLDLAFGGPSLLPDSHRGEMRITYSLVRGGQRGPYQDSERVHRLLIEEWSAAVEGWVPRGTFAATRAETAKTPEGWTPIDADTAKRWARQYSSWQGGEQHGLDSYLDYCRQIGPGLIEWRVVEPYTG